MAHVAATLRMAATLRICPEGACFLDCVLSGDFWPMVIAGFVVFYGSAMIVKFLPLSPKDPTFSDIYKVASHMPSAVLSAFIAWYASRSFFSDLWNLEPAAQLGPIADVSSHNDVVEATAWFVAFLVVDVVLMIMYGYGDFDNYVHHALYGFVLLSQIGGGQCCNPYLVAGLLAMELSTPLLNIFLLLRGYLGLDSIFTQVAFVLFAMAFMTMRVWCIAHIVVHWVFNYQPCYKPYEHTIMMVTMVLSLVLQYYWGFFIMKNLLKGFGCIKRTSRKVSEDHLPVPTLEDSLKSLGVIRTSSGKVSEDYRVLA